MIRLITDSTSPYYSPSTKIMLITPPPVDADSESASLPFSVSLCLFGVIMYSDSHLRRAVRNNELISRTPSRVPDRDSERTRLFAEATKEVASELGVLSVVRSTPTAR